MSERIYTTAEYNSSVHFPPSAQLVKEIPSVGQIYRIPLNSVNLLSADEIKIPEFVLKATKNHNARRGMDALLTLNSRKTPYPWLDKADSCFVAIAEENSQPSYVYDVLVEEGHHVRNNDPILHDYLRTHFEYGKAMPVGNNVRVKNCRAFSGHIAPIRISTREASHILMLDAFVGNDAYDKACAELKILFNVLHTNRIIPLTSNCHPILPRKN